MANRTQDSCGSSLTLTGNNECSWTDTGSDSEMERGRFRKEVTEMVTVQTLEPF